MPTPTGAQPLTRVLMVSSPWPTDARPHVAPFLRVQADALRTLGVLVEVLPFRVDRNPMRALAARRAVRRRLRQGGFDLVHVQFGWSSLLVGSTTAPTVVSFYGSDIEGTVGRRGRYTFSGRFLQSVGRAAARRADAVIAVSESLGRKLPSQTRYHVIPTPVDLDVFKPGPRDEARRQLGLPADGRLILFGGDPGRPEKRFALAQAAVGALPVELRAGLITVQGAPHATVRRHMNACDAIVLTSIHEGSPTMIREALACNLPVVSVDVGDVSEWIGDVDGCVLCRDDKTETITDALQHVLSRSDRFDGREVAKRTDVRVVAARINSVYDEVLARALSE